MGERVKRILVTIVEVMLAFTIAGLSIQYGTKEFLCPTICNMAFFSILLLSTAIIYGLVLMGKARKEAEEDINMAEVEQKRQEYKACLRYGYEKERARILCQMRWGTAYFWCVYMLLLTEIISISMMAFYVPMALVLLPFLVLLLYGINGPACFELEVVGDETFMEEEEYPHLYGMVREVFSTCNVSGPIRLYMFQDLTLGVTRLRGINNIMVGAKLLSLIDEEELRQGLVHEAAHIKNKDTEDTYSLDNAYEKWNYDSSSILGRISSAIIYVLPYLYNKKYLLFRELSSYEEEIRADKYTASICNRQEEMNGLGKVYMYECYLDELDVYDESWYLKNEEPVKETFVDEIIGFKHRLLRKTESWKREIENALTENSASHPSFATRREIMGNLPYEVRFVENSKAYEAERRKLRQAAEQEIYDEIVDRFTQQREESYLKPMRQIQAYEAGEVGTEIPTMMRIAQLYEDVYLYEKALKLYEEILQIDPRNANARYRLGTIKVMRRDRTGIADLYQSVEESYNDCEEKVETIGEYCVKLGMTEEYEHWMHWKNEKLDYYFNQYNKVFNTWKRKFLYTSDLCNELLNRRKYELIAIGQGMIDTIYIVKKQLKNGCKMDVFLLKPKESASNEAWENVLEQVFLLLDNDGEEDVQYGINCLREEPDLEGIVSKVKGSCIYKDR